MVTTSTENEATAQSKFSKNSLGSFSSNGLVEQPLRSKSDAPALLQKSLSTVPLVSLDLNTFTNMNQLSVLDGGKILPPKSPTVNVEMGRFRVSRPDDKGPFELAS